MFSWNSAARGGAWLLALALNVGTARVPEDSGRFTRMVAGEGFEPPTSGL